MPPGPVKISHEKGGRRRPPPRFHVFGPPYRAAGSTTLKVFLDHTITIYKTGVLLCLIQSEMIILCLSTHASWDWRELRLISSLVHYRSPITWFLFWPTTGVDTGFSVGGAPTLRGRGRLHTNLPDFPQKLREIKKILVRRGGMRRGRPPSDPPLNYH